MKPFGYAIRTPALARRCQRPGHGHREADRKVGGLWACKDCQKRLLRQLAERVRRDQT